jgi:CRISPR/Cas system endoribonuclease Cas6 (RAMP superfamily)
MTASEIRFLEATRRSSRTGQRHPIGGFAGRARYEGPLAEFLPWLRTAAFTGVGRQTTWGKGEIRVRVP